MAIKRLGTNGLPIDASQKHWSSVHGETFLGYADEPSVSKRETAAPVYAPVAKKRGRPSMTPAQKAAAKKAREESKTSSDDGTLKKTRKARVKGEERKMVHIRIPTWILDFYKSQGAGYQTKIVNDLRLCVDKAMNELQDEAVEDTVRLEVV